MSLKGIITKANRKSVYDLTIDPDTGWNGIKPAKTRADKINQIKNDFIDERALLVVGATADDFSEYPQISANISVPELTSLVDALAKKKTKKRSLFIITDWEKASAEEQSKFLPLFKDRQIVASSLPDYVQLVLPVSDLDAVSRDTRSVTYPLNV